MSGTFFFSTLIIGSLTFGGGYAMVSALHQDLVINHRWITPEEFSNGVAAGQFTPGPLMVMIAFMGFKIAGIWGALLGTIGLFLPSFCLALLISRYYHRIKDIPMVTAALKGVNAAVVALIATAALELGISALNTPAAAAIAVAAALILGLSRLGPGWAMLLSGLAGACLLR